MEPKRNSPKFSKKVTKEKVPQKLIHEESNYEEEEPLLRKPRKNSRPKKPPPPPLVEVSKKSGTEATTPSESEASK